MDGGAGNDTILGSRGDDMLLGGDGNDFIDGNQGDDVALMGAGDDVFQWDPGDGSDTVEGQDGTDKMLFNGANIAENIDISANGSRVRFTRDVGNIADGPQRRRADRTSDARGGADNVTVNDLTGTDVTQIELDPARGRRRRRRRGRHGHRQRHQGDDKIAVGGDAGGLQVTGLHAAVNIFGQEPTMDRLTVNGLGGDDVINAQSLRADGDPLHDQRRRRRRH